MSASRNRSNLPNLPNRPAERTFLTFAESYTCPDCTAETALTRDAFGIYHLTVMHDETCPTYRAMLHGG